MELIVSRIVNAFETKGITAYKVSKETTLTEFGINKILNGSSKRPHKATIDVIHNYLREKHNFNQEWLLTGAGIMINEGDEIVQMKGIVFKKIRKNLNKTQTEMSVDLGVSMRTVQNWESDTNAIPKPISMLMEKYTESSTTDQTVSERLELVRKEKGLSNYDLSDAFNMSPSGVFIAIEENRVQESHIEIFCNKFGVNKEWILTGEGIRYTKETTLLSVRLEKVIQDSGLTINQFASEMGERAEKYYAIVKGKTQKIDKATADKISKHYGVSSSWIRLGVEDKNTNLLSRLKDIERSNSEIRAEINIIRNAQKVSIDMLSDLEFYKSQVDELREQVNRILSLKKQSNDS